MHRTPEQLKAGLAEILQSPRDTGRVDAIVVRPEPNSRRDLASCRFDIVGGAQGDRWVGRFPSPPLAGMAEQDSQVTLMNSRAVQLVAGNRTRWPLAGDQLYVDLHLGEDNLQPGDQLRFGSVLLEITPEPHNGCRKFADHYGLAALEWVNSPEGKHNHLRGIYARVVQSGEIRVGDAVTKVVRTASDADEGVRAAV